MSAPPSPLPTVTGSEESPVRVLLVDDQALIRLGLRMVLEGDPRIRVVGEAEDGLAGVALAAELQPDVVVMDVRMPGLDGIEATERIVGRCACSRVLIVTTYDLDEYAFASLRAGASGFLLKNAPPAQLVEAIHTVAGGDAIVEPRITRRMLDLFGSRLPSGAGEEPVVEVPAVEGSAVAPAASPVRDPRLAALTEREFEVFSAVARGLTNAEISRALYLAESTVKTHVGHVLLKLGLRDRVHAVVLGYETGVVTPSR